MTTQILAWTHEEGLNFENARELITDLMGIITAEIATEQDTKKIEVLRERRKVLSIERASLHVQDHARIAEVMQKYGSLVRGHYAAHKLHAA